MTDRNHFRVLHITLKFCCFFFCDFFRLGHIVSYIPWASILFRELVLSRLVCFWFHVYQYS